MEHLRLVTAKEHANVHRNVPRMAAKHMRRVAQASAKAARLTSELDQARQELRAAVRVAHESGESISGLLAYCEEQSEEVQALVDAVHALEVAAARRVPSQHDRARELQSRLAAVR